MCRSLAFFGETEWNRINRCRQKRGKYEDAEEVMGVSMKIVPDNGTELSQCLLVLLQSLARSIVRE